MKEAALLQRNLGKIGLAAVLLRGWESTAHAPSKARYVLPSCPHLSFHNSIGVGDCLNVKGFTPNESAQNCLLFFLFFLALTNYIP